MTSFATYLPLGLVTVHLAFIPALASRIQSSSSASHITQDAILARINHTGNREILELFTCLLVYLHNVYETLQF
jgi:hypothetical protein